jgi:hypothetical protein
MSETGVWSPLRSRLFTIIWLTHLFTMLAVFMNGLGGAWVMTSEKNSTRDYFRRTFM